jgi:hypothetical protein
MLLNNDSQGFRRAQFGVVPVRSLLIGMKCPGCSERLDMRDQVKFPPGFKLRPHWHPEAVRTVVILSGALYYANGEQWDESKLKPFPAGTFFSELPRVPHYAWARDGEVVLQLTGIGPTGTQLIEPAK